MSLTSLGLRFLRPVSLLHPSLTTLPASLQQEVLWVWFASLTRSSIVPDTSRSLAMGTCDDQKPKSPGATVLAPQRVPQALPASSSHLSSLRQPFLRCLCALNDGSHHGAPRVSKCARDGLASRLEPAGLRPKCSRRWWQCHGSPCGAARGGGMG
jgi:hypothetical protein